MSGKARSRRRGKKKSSGVKSRRAGAAGGGGGGAGAGGKKKKSHRASVVQENAMAFEHEEMELPKDRILKPKDQVKDLTPEELDTEHSRMLTANDPNKPKEVVEFNYNRGEFDVRPVLDQVAVHFVMESTLMHRDSVEAAQAEDEAEAAEAAAAAAMADAGVGDDEASAQDEDGGGDGVDAQTGDDAASSYSSSDDEAGDGAKRKLRNKFNFSERASQTFNNPMRDREMMTEAPPTRTCNGVVSKWVIFDTYLSELLAQIAAKEAKEREKNANRYGKSSEEERPQMAMQSETAGAGGARAQALSSVTLAKTAHILERMVNENANEETYHDFKYFEDDADKIREDGRGEFLPLWRFQTPASRRKTVTSIKWNPRHSDLFAAGYGSYDFMKQTAGVIVCYSLKNTSHPEYAFSTPSGVMCLDFHPQHPSLLAVGLYDGSVSVYDVRSRTNEPIYTSSDPKARHTDPVWEVHWQAQSASHKELNFLSISTDGRITNWVMRKNELVNEEVLELKLTTHRSGDANGAANGAGAGSKKGSITAGTTAAIDVNDPDNLVNLAGGTCFDFNKQAPHLLVVGTEEGSITSYSTAYNSECLESYAGHHMPVYTVRWNPFHKNVFLSCSADWTVKLWEYSTTEPLMVFDLGTSVGDIAWAPYSSTVFGIITNDGLVRIFDLQVDKHAAIGQFQVVKKSKLTHLSFAPNDPVVLVGDDAGNVTSLKLSPNLRKTTSGNVRDVDPEKEFEKLDRLLVLPEHEDSAARPAPL